LYWVSVVIKYWKVYEAKIKAITRSPYHRSNVGTPEIQYIRSVRPNLIERVWLRIEDVHPSAANKLVDLLLEVLRGLIRLVEVFL